MSRSQRAADQIPPSAPPSSTARYPRSSLRSHKLGSSSTKVQVVGEGPQERGYDSEIARDGGGGPPFSGYHTEQPSSKRSSKDLYRAALDPRRNGARTSSMPQSQYSYVPTPRQSALGDSTLNTHPQVHAPRQDGDDSAAEQSSSLRRVKKAKDNRHRDRDREPYDQNAVPASVWMPQVVDTKPSRSARRDSRSRRHDETPQQIHHTLPPTAPANQDHHRHPHHPSSYSYAQHQQGYSSAPYRAANAHDYRSNGPAPDHYVPSTPQPPLLNATPRYAYVIDDRAGMRSPPPVEIPHAFPSETAPGYDYFTPSSSALPLPRTREQLRADGLIPSSPAHGHRRHRTTRSEDVGAAGGVFSDGTEHVRPPLRHQPSRSEDLRKLGLGQVPGSEEQLPSLARPVHVGRSASDAVLPQQAQLATPGMYTSGLAVTPAATATRPGGLVMHPQLQESFAESANASRAPVNAAMASAAIASGATDSDSSRERRRRSRGSKRVDGPLAFAEAPTPEPQTVKDPSPPPVVNPNGKRQRTVSGRSAIVTGPGDSEKDKDDDMVVYRTPDTGAAEASRAASASQAQNGAPPVMLRTGALRAAAEGQPVGLAIFGSRPEMTPGGARAEVTHVSRLEMTSAGTGMPRADGGNDSVRSQVEIPRSTGAGGVEIMPRRGSVLDGGAVVEERARRPSAAAVEERVKATVAELRRPSASTEEQRRPSPGAEDHRRRSLEKEKHVHARRSIDSDASLESFQSAELAASTAATQEYPADFHSARDPMSPVSNYHSIAPSVRSVVNEARNLANEAKNMANEIRNAADLNGVPVATTVVQGSKTVSVSTVGHRPVEVKHTNGIPPAAASKERLVPSKGPAVPATPLMALKAVESDAHGRPRVSSNNMAGPSEPPAHRATVDVHAREQAPAQVMAVDEEGRLTRVPAPAPVVSSTMPARTIRTSLTMQRPPQTTAPVASPQANGQVPPEPPASALPRNMQQPQAIGSSKESLVDATANPKPVKNKSSTRWFWSKPKPEPAPKTPSPGPNPPPPSAAPPPRVRQTSILGGFMGHSSSSKNKSSRKSPDPHAQAQSQAADMYQSFDSTPSSLTLNLDAEPKKDESRMPRMFASFKNTLRRTPSSAKISHGISRSMSRLPGTTPALPSGVPLARSVSTNANASWLMSPMRSKEPKLAKDEAVPPPPVPASISAPIPIPAPTPVHAPAAAPASAPASVPVPVVPAHTPSPVPAPVPAPPIAAPTPIAPKPRGPPEAVPMAKDERRLAPKEVPIAERARVPTLTSARTAEPSQVPPAKVTRTLVDANGRVVDATGRPIEPTSRSEKRSSTQAPLPLHPRAASPPLVSRPVTATRIPANQSNIFTSGPTPRTAAHPTPIATHTSSKSQPGRSAGRYSRDHSHVPPVPSTATVSSSLVRPQRSREPAPVTVPPSQIQPPHELGLPTPDATPRASPTGEDVFEHRTAALQKEREQRSRPPNIVVPTNLYAVNDRLKADAAQAGLNGPVLKFVHRQKRAVSIASLEAVTGQESHFRSETSSIRTATPGPGQITFPNRDPQEATEDWRMHQLQEDMILNSGKADARRESISSRADGRKISGVLKRERGGLRKPGITFDFPVPVIDEDGEDQFDALKKADIEMTYELERRHKRYK